jgi:hypothetical protein
MFDSLHHLARAGAPPDRAIQSRASALSRGWRRAGLAVLAIGAAGTIPVACATAGSGENPGDGSMASSDDAGVEAGRSLDAADASPSRDVAVPQDSSVAEPDGDAEVAGDANGDDAGDAENEGAAGDGGCPAGKILCGTSCISWTDPSNCGACGVTCGGTCGTTLSADMQQAPANWTFNGVALWDSTGPSARLTTAMTDKVAGSVVYNHSIVTDSFVASFQFRIGENGGGQYDGMGFMLQVNGPTAVGSNGGGLGMSGLDGFGVEFDIYNNGSCGDSNANHVGVDQLTSCGSGLLTSLYASSDLTGTVTLSDAQWHTANVTLDGGSMSVAVDGTSVASSVALPGYVNGTDYYYGFAGAIGGGSGSLGMQSEVKGVTVTFPTPRCL